MGNPRPYRDSSRPVPPVRCPSDRRKVVYYEYGTEYNFAACKSLVYVDVINGNTDLVDFVGFRFWPSGETHNIRKRMAVILSDGSRARRFLLKESDVEHWSKKISIVIFGRGGSRSRRRLNDKKQHFRERPLKFVETKALLPYYRQDPDFSFGIEVETSLGSGTSSSRVVSRIWENAGIDVIDKTDSYRRGTEDYRKWQLVPDGSTVCNLNDPNCNKFELVSRVLDGEDGLEECERVLDALNGIGTVSCNKSMGFHVHVNVEGLSLERLKNICLNFIKHEDAIDSFMPASRQSSNFCRSNKDAMGSTRSSEGDGIRHSAIVACDNVAMLCDTVNPGPVTEARYYKLNLQNLHPHRSCKKQPKTTIEFRQHSGTTNFAKIEAWIRFCNALVRNSIQRPQKLQHYEDAFESLFDTAIQDLKLKAFYKKRAEKVLLPNLVENLYDTIHHGHSARSCCIGCGKGETCER